ncbi:MAG: hypothetical protein QM724_01695 [Flavobacteriales bacterium]
MHLRFPIYLKRTNGLNWYRIDADDRFVEVQRIGGRSLVHEVQARSYPERSRIADLLAGEAGAVVPCSAEEFQHAREKG